LRWKKVFSGNSAGAAIRAIAIKGSFKPEDVVVVLFSRLAVM
jgi:hypothetical protein